MKTNKTFILFIALCSITGCSKGSDGKEGYFGLRPCTERSLHEINQSLKKINQALDRMADLLEKKRA